MERAEHYATLKDVAERAGTTAATVSYVLSNSKKRYISAEMRQRVESAARELNYVKSSAASSLRGKKRKVIAVLVPQFRNDFFIEAVLAIEAVADRFGYILNICNTFDDPEREADIIQRLQAQRVDGYILTPTRKGGENTQQIRRIGTPLVVLDRSLDISEDYLRVSSQNYECTYTATKHLLDHGHRKIAYIGWNDDFGGQLQRQQGYQDAMAEAGVSLEDCIFCNGAYTAEGGMELTRAVLQEHPEVTGLVYAFNLLAYGGIQELARLGVVPGKDISMVIIGAPSWARVGANDLTCVDLGGSELGRMAAELLFEAIHSEEPLAPRTLVHSCSLIEGSSVYTV